MNKVLVLGVIESDLVICESHYNTYPGPRLLPLDLKLGNINNIRRHSESEVFLPLKEERVKGVVHAGHYQLFFKQDHAKRFAFDTENDVGEDLSILDNINLSISACHIDTMIYIQLTRGLDETWD